MDLKNKLIVIGFVLTLLGITMTGVINNPRVSPSMMTQTSVSRRESVEKSFFRNSIYYQHQGQRPFLLEAEFIELDYGLFIKFLKPKGKIFQKQGSKVSYEAKSGFLNEKENVLFLEDSVLVKSKNTRLNSERLKYSFDSMRFEATTKVKTRTYARKTGDRVFINANKFVSYFKNKENIHLYLGNVAGKVKRKRIYEDSLSFKSNKLTFFSRKNLAKLNGKVTLKYRNFEGKAQRGDIFLENYNKDLNYFVLHDDVKVREVLKMKGKKVIRKAFSEKLEGYPKNSLIVLTGYPKVLQGQDAIIGNKIILRWNNEVLEIIDANSNLKLK